MCRDIMLLFPTIVLSPPPLPFPPSSPSSIPPPPHTHKELIPGQLSCSFWSQCCDDMRTCCQAPGVTKRLRAFRPLGLHTVLHQAYHYCYSKESKTEPRWDGFQPMWLNLTFKSFFPTCSMVIVPWGSWRHPLAQVELLPFLWFLSLSFLV